MQTQSHRYFCRLCFNQDEGALDDIHFVRLELAGEDLRLYSALRTRFVGRIEGVHLFQTCIVLVACAAPKVDWRDPTASTRSTPREILLSKMLRPAFGGEKLVATSKRETLASTHPARCS